MTLFQAFGQFAGQAAAAGPPGMVLVKPTSISHTGTSATLGTDGGVEFTAVTVLSLNGIFTADFDNYFVSMNLLSANTVNLNVDTRMRASGTDATGSDYTRQVLQANGTSVTSSRSTSLTSFPITAPGANDWNGANVYFYGPALAQTTMMRSVTTRTISNAYIQWDGGAHGVSTAYDGMTLLPGSAITGTLQVYGVRS